MPLRVLVTVPQAVCHGGAETMLERLILALDDEVEVTLVFLQDGPWPADLAARGVRTVVIDAGRLRNVPRAMRTIAQLARLIRTERPDVVLDWSAKSHLYGSAASILGRSRSNVWWQHSVPRPAWIDRAATILPANAVGTSSQASARAQTRIRPRRRVFTVYPGIDDHSPSGLSGAVRAQYGVPNGRILVGIVGRLHPEKGQHRFLEMVALLRAQGYDIHGLLIGGPVFGVGDAYPRLLRDAVERLDLSEHVTFTGHVDDPRTVIAALDIFVSASEMEPFGIVIIEAMAAGIPVVVPAVGGPMEIVEDGRSGIIARSPAAGDLATAVGGLLADGASMTAISRSAKERAKDFSVDAAARAFARSLRDCLPS